MGRFLRKINEAPEIAASLTRIERGLDDLRAEFKVHAMSTEEHGMGVRKEMGTLASQKVMTALYFVSVALSVYAVLNGKR